MKKLIYIIAILGIIGLAYWGISAIQRAKADIYGSSLVGWWRFDTNSDIDGATKDDSGSGNNGNLKNIASSTFYSYGKIGQGFNFDGVNDYVNATGTNLSLNGTGAVSVGGWFKINSLASVQGLTAKQIASGWNTFNLLIPSATLNSVRFTVENQTLNQFPQWMASTTVGWHHIVGTFQTNAFNSTDGKIYIDGVAQTTIFTANSYASNYVLQESAQPLIFGARPVSFTQPFNGIMDDVRIYNRALSAGEVAQLYNMGMTQFNSFSDF